MTALYGVRAWPDFDALSGELHFYAESTERMKAIKNACMCCDFTHAAI